MPHLGVDIGGTFTDTVLATGDDIHTIKTPTTDDLISGIVSGIDAAVSEAGISLSAVDSFNHGSTVAVNTLIEKTGARTAILTSEGFRDVFEIGEAFRDAALLYDPQGEHHPPLVPRRRRYEVPERMRADGTVATPLDEEAVRDVASELESKDVESVAVCFLHSYLNSEHEHRAREIIETNAPGIDVSVSADISPEIREYTRTATTTADAYIKPKVSSYVEQLESTLRENGLEGGINIMKSDGGLARPHVASTRPITQTISGPVAGVKAAQFFADSTDIQNIITFDMGGTSCDTALVQDGTPVEEPHRKIQGLKINGPFVSINTVGAGGGSIAWLDEVDALRVGPRSSGATPGPACYGRGGTEPTVTDANLVLGVLNPSNFAGGEMDLDVDAARASLEPIAEALGVGIEGAAVAVRSVVDSNLASAIRVVSVKEGYDPREFALMAFGGAGPAHACNVADKLDIDTVIFPANSGLFSATGLLQSDIRHEYVQSIVKLADAVDSGRLDDRVDAMVEDANEELSSERVPPADRSFQISFDAQYEGQAHYLTVPLGGTTVNDAALSAFADRFEEMHESRFGFRDEENPIEIVNIRVTATGAIGLDDVRTERDTESGGENAAKRGERTVRLSDDRTVIAPHYEWERLSPEATIDGPAIVEARNSTAWIAPAFDATVRPDGTLLARRGAHE